MAKVSNIYVGGWFQRTTLHLSEIYDFLENARSPLKLDEEKLKTLRGAMDIALVRMEISRLDRVELRNNSGITVKIYEDGLVVLGKENKAALAQASRCSRRTTRKNFLRP